jgi:hypothetical protein
MITELNKRLGPEWAGKTIEKERDKSVSHI